MIQALQRTALLAVGCLYRALTLIFSSKDSDEVV
jgi:hypothetical protein